MNSKKSHILLTMILIIAIVTACQASQEATPTDHQEPAENLDAEQLLVLGDVSGDAAWTIEHFQPLADYLADNLHDFGIKQGKVVVTKDLASMMEYLETGQVDLYFDSPYPALEVYQQIGAQPLARRWKSGVSEYHTLIVVNKDTGITDLEGLQGEILAFDHPASTSGHLLPKAYLVLNEYQVLEKDDVSGTIKSDEIGYVFAYGDENVVAWVLQGKTTGAAIPNGDYDALDDDQRDQLIVLGETPSVPRHIALAKPDMDPALQEEITQLLLALAATPEGQAILEIFEGTSQFDEFPLGAEETMQALDELFAPVR